MPATPAPVPEFTDVDRARFEAEIVPAARPAVLRGLAAHWPAVRAGRDSAEAFTDYLNGHATDEGGETWFGDPAIGGHFAFNADFTALNHERKLVSIPQIMDLLMRSRDAAAPTSIYAGALALAKHAPRFAAENPMPLLDPGQRMIRSLWLGNRTKTAAHWDLPQNLACVLLGRRRFTLFPPDQIGNLYVGPIEMTLAGQPTSLADVENPDLDRFPRLAEALEHAMVADLEPGDVLYIPSLWWHAVSGQDPVGAMVNYWWRDNPERANTPLFALLHALLLMHKLPGHEKTAWKAMFDHYVFGENGDPQPHLPESARGILGERSPGRLAQIRAQLVRSLDPK